MGRPPGRIARRSRFGLVSGELRDAYPMMLSRLREVLLSELHVPNTSPAMLEELRARAKNVRELGGDHRLEAFIIGWYLSDIEHGSDSEL